jgi:hypothetical protein
MTYRPASIAVPIDVVLLSLLILGMLMFCISSGSDLCTPADPANKVQIEDLK